MSCNTGKYKFDRKSIKTRLCLYFCLFAAFLLALLWTLQIFFLNTYYQEMKISQTTRIANMISEKYGTEDFLPSVYDAVVSNDIFVQIEDRRGEYILYSSNKDTGGRAPNFPYVSEMASVKKALDDNHYSGNTNGASMIIDLKGDRRILAYANYISSPSSDEDVILYLFSPLYPVESTVGILKNQLIYVTIISFALAFVLAIYMSGRITKPLRGITESAGKLAKGDMDVVFEGGHYSEIEQLADTLNKASADLKKNDALRKDLIANVSHDLRTPLTMVKSYAEMIRDISGENREKRNAHLNVIIEEADRLSELVTDVLDLSRLQNHVIPLETKKVDICEMTRSYVNSKELYTSREGYEIELCVPEEPLYVMADENKLIRVMDNLFNNGLKYCGEDKKLLISVGTDIPGQKEFRAVNYGAEDEGKKWVRWEITDHGKGISYEEQEQIWDRYYKTSTNHVRVTKGTGLGLAIVKEIVNQHNGRYGIHSIPGEGSTFFFELSL